MTTTIRTRSEIPAEQTWDVASVFADDAAWESAITQIETQTASLAAFQGRLHEGPVTVALWMNGLEQVMRNVWHVYVYASMFYNVDTSDQDAQAKQDRAIGVFTRTQAATAFAEPELLAMGIDTLKQWAAKAAG